MEALLLYLSWFDFVFSEVLDALEMESRILWNLRLVVLIAVPVGIFWGISNNSKQSRMYKSENENSLQILWGFVLYLLVK